ncbi:hypothetical protein ACWPKO_12790 [Coraliomargarita sp. W4R53]
MKAIGQDTLASVHVSVVNAVDELGVCARAVGLWQAAFASLLDTLVGTVRGWEQGEASTATKCESLDTRRAQYLEQVLESCLSSVSS